MGADIQLEQGGLPVAASPASGSTAAPRAAGAHFYGPDPGAESARHQDPADERALLVFRTADWPVGRRRTGRHAPRPGAVATSREAALAAGRAVAGCYGAGTTRTTQRDYLARPPSRDSRAPGGSARTGGEHPTGCAGGSQRTPRATSSASLFVLLSSG